MDLAEAVKAIQPLRGEIVPIRTVQETRPPEEFGMIMHDPESQLSILLTNLRAGDAFVAEVNVKGAAKVIK